MFLRSLIFSKDRAPQLELLLRSMATFAPSGSQAQVSVLFKVRDGANGVAYSALAQEYPQVDFVEESDIVQNVRNLSRGDFLQYLVDDDVMVRPWSLEDQEFQTLRSDPMVCCLALRMGPWMDFCYPCNIVTPPPPMRFDRTWYWPGLDGDWGYPNSIDGNVYRAEDLRGVLEAGGWDSPSRFEPLLRGGCRRPLMVCYAEPRIVNVSANSNQDAAPVNRNAGVSQSEMDERYARGERIKLEPFLTMRRRSPHFEAGYEWESKP